MARLFTSYKREESAYAFALRQWLMDFELEVATRLAVLQAYQANPPKGIERDLAGLMRDPAPAIRVAAAEARVALFPEDVLRMAQQLLTGQSDAEKRGAYRMLAADKGQETLQILAEQFKLLQAGEIPASLRLDVYEACGKRKEFFEGPLETLNAELMSDDPLTGALVYTLEGGDPKNGESVFANQGTCRKCHTR